VGVTAADDDQRLQVVDVAERSERDGGEVYGIGAAQSDEQAASPTRRTARWRRRSGEFATQQRVLRSQQELRRRGTAPIRPGLGVQVLVEHQVRAVVRAVSIVVHEQEGSART